MFARILLLFSIVPLVELALLIKVGSMVGLLPTILLVCGTGFTGAFLAKSQGFKLFRQVSESLREGQIPADHLIEGLLILIGGVFLLTPGLITDCTGFLLLIPTTRRVVARWGKHKFKQWIERGGVHFSYDEYRPDHGGFDPEPEEAAYRSSGGTGANRPHAAPVQEDHGKPVIDVEFEDIRE